MNEEWGVCVGNHALTENKRPGSNSLKSEERREPSDTGTRVTYVSVVSRNDVKERMKD